VIKFSTNYLFPTSKPKPAEPKPAKSPRSLVLVTPPNSLRLKLPSVVKKHLSIREAKGGKALPATLFNFNPLNRTSSSFLAPQVNTLEDFSQVSTIDDFSNFIGFGICKPDDLSSYKQILTKKIFNKATKVFSTLSPDEKEKFLKLLKTSHGNAENNSLAVSALFAALAYGSDFAKKFIASASAEGSSLKASFSRGKEYFDVQQNFTQNYLNTCVSVSAFTAVSNAFGYNVEILKFVSEYELENLKKKGFQ
jgi:hypothetical protein